MSQHKLIDELHNFKKRFNLNPEELEEINKFIDSIDNKIQSINKKLDKNKIEQLAKTVKTLLNETDHG